MHYILNLFRVNEDGKSVTAIGSKCDFDTEAQARERGLAAFRDGECSCWNVELVFEDEDDEDYA